MFGIPITTIIVWIIIGLLAGTAAGSIMGYSRRGYGIIVNTLIGLVGALIGGFLFDILQINIGTLSAIQINMQQLLAAFVGAVLFILVIRLIQRRRL